MSKRLLIVRHAERPSIPEGQIGNELSLTEDGVKATKQFARTLEGKVVSIQSSPIQRCLQTAEIIANEYGYDPSDIETSKLLGDPGFFIDDADLAWQNWQEKGSESVNLHLLSGTDTWPGFHPFHLAVSNMVSQVCYALESMEEGIVIWITHDTILATLAGRITEEPLGLSDWPNFLGYLDFSLNRDGKLVHQYHQI